MLKIILHAVAPYIVMFLAAYLATSLVFKAKAKKGQYPTSEGRHAKREKLGVMDKILIIEAVAIILYIIADFLVFWHTGGEPATLTVGFFAVCGGENGFMAWIKTRKEQERMRKWQIEDQEPPKEYTDDEAL